MCKLCDKIEFAIETLEALIPLDEWRKTMLEMLEDDAALAVNPQTETIISSARSMQGLLSEDRNIMVNVIAKMLVTWSIRSRIPPQVILLAVHSVFHEMLEMGHAEARQAHEKERQKRREFDS